MSILLEEHRVLERPPAASCSVEAKKEVKCLFGIHWRPEFPLDHWPMEAKQNERGNLDCSVSIIFGSMLGFSLDILVTHNSDGLN